MKSGLRGPHEASRWRCRTHPKENAQASQYYHQNNRTTTDDAHRELLVLYEVLHLLVQFAFVFVLPQRLVCKDLHLEKMQIMVVLKPFHQYVTHLRQSPARYCCCVD